MRASIDCREGAKNREMDFDVDRQGVSGLVGRLDGKMHTLLCIFSLAETLMIGGGPDLAVVSLINQRGDSLTLKGDATEAQLVAIVVGGQKAGFKRSELVRIATASIAAEAFFDGAHRLLSWSPD